MARDLIPPASPAGRPPADGTPHLIELPPEPSPHVAESEPRTPTGPSEFRNRFGFLMGALAGVFIAAALVAVVLVSSDRGDASEPGLAKNWSKWQPADTSVDAGAAEIAKKVGAEYTHPNGQQLVLVTGSKLPVDVALRPATGPISVLSGTGVLYQLNGLGPGGSIKGGTPSENRLKVIHREGLELALYTFRYLPEVDMVVTLLPPPPPSAAETAASAISGSTTTTNPNSQIAMFYRPGDLKQQLQVPLGNTLSAKAPNADTVGGREAQTVELLTQSNIFKWDVPTGQSLLVLER